MPPGIEPTRPNPALCWRPLLAVGWDYNIFLERSAFFTRQLRQLILSRWHFAALDVSATRGGCGRDGSRMRFGHIDYLSFSAPLSASSSGPALLARRWVRLAPLLVLACSSVRCFSVLLAIGELTTPKWHQTVLRCRFACLVFLLHDMRSAQGCTWACLGP